MKIAILDDYQNITKDLECFKLLKRFDVTIFNTPEKDTEILSKKLSDFEIIVLTRERTQISEELLSKLPNLKLISQTGKISNHLDLASCNKHKVAVAEGSGSPIAPAELTWALIMNVVRQIPSAMKGMKQGKWQTNIGSSIYGKTIGIWGYGKIGKRIAKYADAFGAEVIVWGSETSREQAVLDGFKMASSKEIFFTSSDIVTVHLRLNEKTFGIIKEGDLKMMKPSASFINTARAELVELGALIKCLNTGRPGFAGIDVYEEEPIYNTNFKLLRMPNVV